MIAGLKLLLSDFDGYYVGVEARSGLLDLKHRRSATSEQIAFVTDQSRSGQPQE